MDDNIMETNIIIMMTEGFDKSVEDGRKAASL